MLATMDPGAGDARGKGMADPDLVIEFILSRFAGFLIAMRPIGVRRWRNVAGDARGFGFPGLGQRVA